MARVNEIKKGEYVGYYWKSDCSEPVVLNGEAMIELTNSNPFVIEAQLYDDKQKLSYSVKYVDGEYIIVETKVTEDVVKNYTSYIANRMPGIKALHFTQRWAEEPDENCMGMNVLQPAEFVFVGFEK